MLKPSLKSYRKANYCVWNMSGLHKAQTLTTLNTFVMSWNAGCEPDLITQQQDLTWLIIYFLKLIKQYINIL